MTKNVTLKLDEGLLRRCRRLAVAKDKSLSQWLMELMVHAKETAYGQARLRALKGMEKGFYLGGKPLTREEAHAK